MAEVPDTRPVTTIIRQYELLGKIKRDLIKAGDLNGDATPAQVLDALRRQIPPELFQR